MAHSLASMNILYVKLFQSIAFNNSWIGEQTNDMLLQFTDNAPWDYDDIDLDLLFELHSRYNLNFVDGLERPAKSGMISLVYNVVQTDNNQPLVVKIQRKRIAERLDESIEYVLHFVRLLKCIPAVQKYQLSESIEQNIGIIREQLDFDKEVQNMIRMKNNCKRLKYVVIPDVYKEVTDQCPTAILMEKITGLTIRQLEESDYEPFAKQVLKFGCVTSMVHGFAHGDLHAGNILFIKEKEDSLYKLGILDYGIMYELKEDFRKNVLEIACHAFSINTSATAKQILESGLIEPDGILQKLPAVHYENIVSITKGMLDEIMENKTKATQFQFYKFISRFMEYMSYTEFYQLGLKPSDNFIKLQLVLAMAQGVTLTLCKENCVDLFDTVVKELFHINLLDEEEEKSQSNT
jgi:predicted unusual protein kinase regulating ubiquinone biosynthesis (AarF/ABC1/UbiB family)